jgi:prepilin-type N-terminal cleavage/methylation domain-containing protein/prepilin-type processing-associated H-X9-DG protein
LYNPQISCIAYFDCKLYIIGRTKHLFLNWEANVINEVPTRFSRCSIPRSSCRGFTLVELLVCIGMIVMLIAILLPAVRKSVEAGRQVSCLNHLRQIAQATLLYCADNEGTFPSGAAVGIAGSPPSDLPRPSDWIFWKTGLSAPYNALPYSDTARSAVGRYIGSSAPTVFRCPSDSCDVRPPHSYSQWQYLYSYSMNSWIAQNQTLYQLYWHHWCRTQDIVNSSEVILLVDEDDQSIDDGSWLPAGIEEPSGQFVHNQISNRHDVNRDAIDASSSGNYDPSTRGNVAFCDGHGEFVTRQFSWMPEHYTPTNRLLPKGY